MIEIHDNFLSKADFENVQEEVLNLEYELIPLGNDIAYKLDTGNIFKTHLKYWSDNPIIAKPFFSALSRKIQQKYSMMVHVYEPGAEIGWHKDYSSILSYSFYIHNQWKSEWGGQLMYTECKDTYNNNGNVFRHRQDVMDPGIGHYIEPKPNRLVIIKDCLHKVNRVNQRRISLTGFVK